MNSEFSARSTHAFSSYLEIKGNQFANKKLKITLGHSGNIPPAKVFSIFTSTEGYDTRPKIHMMDFSDLQSDKPEIRKSLLEINATSNYYPLKYEVYVKESHVGVNMATPCSIRYNQALKIYENIANGGNIFYAKISMFSDKNYWVNVIVTDALGRESAFEFPMYILKKTIPSTKPSIDFASFAQRVYTLFIIVLVM